MKEEVKEDIVACIECTHLIYEKDAQSVEIWARSREYFPHEPSRYINTESYYKNVHTQYTQNYCKEHQKPFDVILHQGNANTTFLKKNCLLPEQVKSGEKMIPFIWYTEIKPDCASIE